MNAPKLRFFCRNVRCRTKLSRPVDNEHKAFCTQYCYDQFYKWRCKVCEKDLPQEGHRRNCCRSPECRRNFNRFRDAYSLPRASRLPPPTECPPDARSAHFTGLKNPVLGWVGWAWDDTKGLGEYWLYLHGRVVAIVVEVAADDFRIPYPRTYPVQGASTLEAARKLAMNVALWTLPPGGIKPAAEKPHKDDSEQQAANDQADAEYVAADEQRLAANESGQ